MARKSPLVVVPDDAEPEPVAALNVSSAASSGTRRGLLVALRDRIAVDIDNGVPPRDLASLSRRLLEIARDIESIDAEDKGDDVGEAADTPDEPWSG